jgi:hypothetical protein
VVLYELLTGHLPYRMRSHILHEIARVICEEEPTRPSAVITEVDLANVDSAKGPQAESVRRISEVREGNAVHLRHRLEGDLDNILLKALQKAPSRRYSSADQFSEDVARHLEGLPVGARKDTVWYRAGKFMRRHQIGLLATVLIVAAAVLGLITTIWQTRVALQALPANARTMAVLAPELVEFIVIVWIGFGVAVYFAQASLRRVSGALAGGVAIMLLLMVEEMLPASMRYFNWTVAGQPTALVYAGVIPYGALVGLLGWRITRRFGWRGQLALLVAASIGGPIRDHLYTNFRMPGIAGVPGILAWFTQSVFWLSGVGSGQAMMRLIAGPAGHDRLPRPPWKL